MWYTISKTIINLSVLKLTCLVQPFNLACHKLGTKVHQTNHTAIRSFKRHIKKYLFHNSSLKFQYDELTVITKGWLIKDLCYFEMISKHNNMTSPCKFYLMDCQISFLILNTYRSSIVMFSIVTAITSGGTWILICMNVYQ